MSHIATGTWKERGWGKVLLVVALGVLSGAAWAQSSVQYGRITNVNLVNTDSSGAQVGGALVGGTLGAASAPGALAAIASSGASAARWPGSSWDGWRPAARRSSTRF